MSNSNRFAIVDQNHEPLHSLKSKSDLKEKIGKLRKDGVKQFHVLDTKEKTATTWNKNQKNYFETAGDYAVLSAPKKLATNAHDIDATAKEVIPAAEEAAADSTAPDAATDSAKASTAKK